MPDVTCLCICVIYVSTPLSVQSPNSTCTHSSSSTCDGHCGNSFNAPHSQFNSDTTFPCDDSNNYNMRLISEHQYEAIKDDGEGFNGLIDGSKNTRDEIIHSNTCRTRQKNYRRTLFTRGVCYSH